MPEIARTAANGAPRRVEVTGEDFARQAARVAVELKCENLVVLDLRGLSTLADYFVIGTSRSDRQGRAVLEQITALAKSLGRSPFTTPDALSGAWMLADFVDVVVHLFDAEHREYYDLDGLWGDAPRLALASEPPALGAG